MSFFSQPMSFFSQPPRNRSAGSSFDVDPDMLNHRRANYASYAIALIVDNHDFSVQRFSRRLRSLWLLQDRFVVEGKIDRFFIINFTNLYDRDFVVQNGPWAIDNSLLVVDRWKPNLGLRGTKLLAFSAWVQFWGLPLEYHSLEVAETLGDVVGNTAYEGGGRHFTNELHYVSTRVLLDPSLPLIQNIRVRTDDGSEIWVECRYERIFRVCGLCHEIGHLTHECNHHIVEAFQGMNLVHNRVYRRFGSIFSIDFQPSQNENLWRDWIRHHTARGSIRIRFLIFQRNAYRVSETTPQAVLTENARQHNGFIHFSSDDLSDSDAEGVELTHRDVPAPSP